MAILECKNLTKRFGATAALQDVSLEIAPGRTIGLLGPNGSGKTTLLKLANGLLTPDGGTLAIDGMAPGGRDEKDRLLSAGEKLFGGLDERAAAVGLFF